MGKFNDITQKILDLSNELNEINKSDNFELMHISYNLEGGFMWAMYPERKNNIKIKNLEVNLHEARPRGI